MKPQNNGYSIRGHDFGRGLVFSNNTTNNTFAEFWWKNTYELNGITQNVSTNYTISNNREDGKNRRYFIPDQGSLLDRKIIFYLRGPYSSSVIQSLIRQGELEDRAVVKGRRSKQEKIREAIGNMEKDGVILRNFVDGVEHLALADRNRVIKILKKYRKGFIGTLEENLYSLLDEP